MCVCDIKNCLTLVAKVESLKSLLCYYAIKAIRPFLHASCCAYKSF